MLRVGAFAYRLKGFAAEVGRDPARPGLPDPARAGDPCTYWHVVLSETLLTAANRIEAAANVALFGLIGWLAVVRATGFLTQIHVAWQAGVKRARRQCSNAKPVPPPLASIFADL
ncbi:MAG: hypothetical protein RIR33_12 [Pseudomonadota bacterium]|jgi:hypothetical protein